MKKEFPSKNAAIKGLPVLIAACLLSALPSFSQSNDWSWAKQVSTSGYCFTESIITDHQHNSYMAGSFDHYISFGDTAFVPHTYGGTDSFIAKYNPDGDFSWALHFYTTDGVLLVDNNKMEILNDSSFVVYGQFMGTLHISDQLITGHGYGWNTYVAKFTFGGNLVNLYQIGGTLDAFNHLLKADKDGNLFLTVLSFYGGYNYTMSFGSDTTFMLNRTSQFLAEFSPDLTLKWVYRYSCLYDFSEEGSLMTDESGNVTLMIPDIPADVIFNQDTFRPHTSYPAFFHTFNSAGIPVLIREVPNHAINWSIQDTDHNIYTFGVIRQHDTLVLGQDTIFTHNTYDLLLLRYDSLFNIKWYRQIPRGYGTWEYYPVQLTDDQVVIGANYESYVNICNMTFPTSSPSEFAFAFYNKDGTCTNAFTTKSNNTFVGACGFSLDDCNDLVLCGDIVGETYFGKDTLNAPNGSFIACFHHGAAFFDLGPDTTVCGSITLNGPPGCLEYHWNDGSSQPSLTVNQTGRYSLRIVTGNNCHAKDSVFITVKPLPQVELGNDTTIMNHDSIILEAPPGYNFYLWNTGDTLSSVVVKGSELSAGTYQFKVTVTLNNCENSDSIKITIRYYPGIFENEKNKSIRILPNPAHSEVSVQFTGVPPGDFIVDITSLRDECVLKKQIRYDGGKNPVSVALPEVEQGIYFIRITGEKLQFFEKLIII